MQAITQKEFQESLAKFVAGLANKSARRRIRVTTPLFSDGLIDSLKILDLIAFIETTLAISIPDRKITLENFRNIQAIGDAFWKRRSEYAPLRQG